MEIKKEFLENQKILLVVSGEDYYKEILNNVRQLSGKSICYVTLNKTHKALREDFKKNKIDMKNMIIVDAISRTIETTSKIEKNCFFVSSPGALTELSIAIKKFLDNNFEYLVFDSLHNLLVYRKMPIVKRWVTSIMGKIKESNTKAIFYTLNLDEQKNLIRETSIFADKIVDLGKEKETASVFSGKLSEEESTKKVKTNSKIEVKDEEAKKK